MTRRARTRTFAAAGATVLALVAIPRIGRLFSSPVPTMTVSPGPFERRVVAEGNLEAADATPVTAPVEAQGQLKISWLVPDGTRVKTGDVVVRFDRGDMERALRDGEASRSTAESKMNGSKAASEGAIRNLERDGAIAREERDATEKYKATDPDVFSRQEIIRDDIDRSLADTRIESAEKNRAIKESLAKVDLDLLDIDRRKAAISVDRAKKGLEALEIRAPHDGILVYRRDWSGQSAKVGDSVWPGDPVADIPNLSTLQARVFVLEADAGGLLAGLPVKVTIEAHPETVYDAKITKVDTLAKRRVGWIPVQYFGATLALASTDPDRMKPGERVQAVITLDARKEAISVPRNAIFEKDGKKIVYRRKHFSFAPVEVALGPAAVGRVVIDRGIGAGDEIALADPSAPAPSAPRDGGTGPASGSPPALGGAR